MMDWSDRTQSELHINKLRSAETICSSFVAAAFIEGVSLSRQRATDLVIFHFDPYSTLPHCFTAERHGSVNVPNARSYTAATTSFESM